MNFLVLSCSLNPESRSRILARASFDALGSLDVERRFIDLRDHPLPMCDGETVYKDTESLWITEQIEKADGILVAAPIYNWDVNAATKNVMEIAGDAWIEKVVGFLCAAGGVSSYMAVMSFANSLMLDFRSVIVPRFVFAGDDAFNDYAIEDEAVLNRIDELARTLVRFTGALRGDTGEA